MTPRAIVAGGGDGVTSSQEPQETAADGSGRSGRVWLSPLEPPEQTLLDGAEIGEALTCLEVPRRPRDKGLPILRRCRLGARIGPSALAVPDVCGQQDHQRRGGIGTSRWWLLTALPSPTCAERG